MQTAFDLGYMRLAELTELASGTARVFRAGGTTVLLIRDESEVLAFDGSCVAQDRALRGGDLVRAIVECLAPGSLSSKVFDAARLRAETENFRGWPRMPTTVEENAIWVNLNEPVAR